VVARKGAGAVSVKAAVDVLQARDG